MSMKSAPYVRGVSRVTNVLTPPARVAIFSLIPGPAAGPQPARSRPAAGQEPGRSRPGAWPQPARSLAAAGSCPPPVLDFRRTVPEGPGMDSEPGYLRIATEEAFAPPELITLWRSMIEDGSCDDPGFLSLPGFYLRNQAERPAAILARLQDLGERRIADMDAAGIDRQ